MSRVAIINNGQVINVVRVNQGQAMPSDGVAVDDVSPVSKGWAYAAGEFTPPPVVPDPKALEQLLATVDAERDRRIAAGFDFMGHTFQSRSSDRENIAALGTDALEAIRNGSQPGDYLWHPEFPQGFAFITAANDVIPLDAYQMRDLRGRGTAYKAAQTFYARGLKDALIAADQAGGDPATIPLYEGWPS